MKVAALDLGTNTFLCLIAEGDRKGLHRVIRDEVEVVRLGQEVDKTGQFHEDALVRAKECLTRFRQRIDEEQVDIIQAVATSAARDVTNGDALFQIAKNLEIPLEIISGDREAQCSYAGACSDFEDDLHRLVIDIGGGSTELILGRGRELLFARSLDIGAVRLTERFLTGQPVRPNERLALEEHVQNEVQKSVSEIKKFAVHEIVAVAGTPTALATMEIGGFEAQKIEGFFLTESRLKFWVDELARLSVEEKKQKYNLGGRADIIFAGTTILKTLVENFSQTGVRVSVKGLRYGLALQLLASS